MSLNNLKKSFYLFKMTPKKIFTIPMIFQIKVSTSSSKDLLKTDMITYKEKLVCALKC